VQLPTFIHRKHFLRDASIVAAITLCFFIPAAEIALRITCTYCTWTEQNGEGFVSPWALRESSWYHVRAPGLVTTLKLPEFDYEITTNSLGLRDIEHPTDKPEGEYRILGIGDSFTEGWGARFEKTWLKQLSNILNEDNAGFTVNTMSGGVSGSDPFYGYMLMVDKLLVYQPDAVLLVINHSDILDVVVRGGMERFQPDGTVKGLDSPEMPWMYEDSQFARFILFEVFDYTHQLLRRPERNRRAAESLTKIEQLVLEFDRSLKSRGIQFFLVVHPYYNELRRNSYDKIDRVIEFATQHEINVIDTKPYLYEKLIEHDNQPADLYWPIDMHFTELGYRYFAEAIENGLHSKLVLEEAN
jgi:lysophospholipase L1-like esterase